MQTHDKCPVCGSKSLLQQPYSVFCYNCGADSLNPARSKLDDVQGIIPAPDVTEKSIFREWIYFVIALVCIIVFFGIKVFA